MTVTLSSDCYVTTEFVRGESWRISLSEVFSLQEGSGHCYFIIFSVALYVLSESIVAAKKTLPQL